ncbi:MAG: molybdopterin-containing oxidoreductase family protein [Planctomycetota bacterium]|jgi:anaerobic selenocysteine-containing dehydrogenase
MRETGKSADGFNRREVLAAGLAGAGAAGAGLLFGRALMGGQPEGTEGEKEGKILPMYDQVIPTTCAECPAGCGLLAHLKGPKIVWLAGNPDHPVNRGGICLRALGAVDRQASPFRVLHPRIRDGERGSGKWRRVGWDEAMKEIVKNKGSRTAFVDGSHQETGSFLEEAFEKGGLKGAYFSPPPYEPNGLAARASMFGPIPASFFSWIDATDTVLNFGGDFFSPGDPRMVEASLNLGGMERSRIVTVSSRMSRTAARSDEWVSIAPASEGVVACAVAREMIGYFVPGKLGKKGGGANDLFWNTHLGSSQEEIREALKKYTPEMVKDASGVSEATVRGLADVLRKGTAPLVFTGPEATAGPHGFETQRAVDLLNVLVGLVHHHPWKLKEGAPKSYFRAPAAHAPLQVLRTLLEGKEVFDLLVLHEADLAQSGPDPHRVISVMKDSGRVKCLVVCEDMQTRTGSLADVVLPAATALEGWGLHHGVGRCISLRRPVAELLPRPRQLRDGRARGKKFAEIMKLSTPRGEARSFAEICTRVIPEISGKGGELLSLEEHFSGLDFAELRETGFIEESLWEPMMERYGTPSGRIELKSPAGSFPAPFAPDLKDDDLILIPYEEGAIPRGPQHSKLLRETRSRNPLWMHPKAARSRGLKNGQKVKVKSDTGEVEAVLKVTRWVHENAVALAFGYGYEVGPPEATAIPKNSSDPESGRIWWAPHGPGPNVAELVKFDTDPEGGGVAWVGTKVTVEG